MRHSETQWRQGVCKVGLLGGAFPQACNHLSHMNVWLAFPNKPDPCRYLPLFQKYLLSPPSSPPLALLVSVNDTCSGLPRIPAVGTNDFLLLSIDERQPLSLSVGLMLNISRVSLLSLSLFSSVQEVTTRKLAGTSLGRVR